jgi:hypothetical protein
MESSTFRPLGFNLGGWLSQSSLTAPHVRSFIIEEDFARISSWGFNSIRLPLDGHWLFKESGRGWPDPKQLDFLIQTLHWAKDAKLHVVLDMHETPWHSFAHPERMDLCDQPEALHTFARQWQQLARHLKGWDAPVWYDVLNEPTADPENWNRILKVLISAIREEDAERILVLESTGWGSIPLLEPLVKVFGGKNIVHSFHFYEPLFVTHQHAPWWKEGRPYTEDVLYPGPIPKVEEYLGRADLPPETRDKLLPHLGKEWDKAALRELLSPLAGLMKDGHILYCGEFGVIDQAPMSTRLNWIRDIVGLLKEMDIGWSYWNYRNLDFGVWSGPSAGREDHLVQPLLDVLKCGI